MTDDTGPVAPEAVEIWKPSPGLPGYEVSTLGRFRSWWSQGRPGTGSGRGYERIRSDKPTIINPWKNSGGYMMVSCYGGPGVQEGVCGTLPARNGSLSR